MYNWFYRIFLLLLPFVYTGNLIDPVLIPRQLYLSIFLLIVITILFFKNSTEHYCDFSYLKNNAIYAFVLFVILNFTSIFFANTLSEAIYVCSKTGILFIFLVITMHLIYNNKLKVTTITESVIMMSLIVIFFGVYQIIVHILWGISAMDDHTVTSLIANKNLLASLLFLMLPFNLFGLTRKGLWKIVALISILFTFFLIWLLQTRAVFLGALTALIAGFVVYFFSQQHQTQKKITIVSFLKRKVTVFILLMILFFAAASYYTILKRGYFLNDGSILTRFVMWEKTILMIMDHPLGVGAGNWQVIFPSYILENMKKEILDGIMHFQRPHNDFLWIAAETGIAGIIAYTGIFIFVFSSLIKKLKITFHQNEFWLYLFIFSGLIGYFFISFSDFPYERIEHQLLVLFFVAMASSNSSSTKTANIKFNKKIFLFFLLPVLFSIIVCINRISGEKHTRIIIDAHHKEDWIKLKIEGKKALNIFYTMDPMSTPIYWYIGVADFSLKNFEAAKDDFLNAYSIHPNHIHVLNNLASSYEKIKNHQEAIKYYLRAIELAPLFLEARLNLCGAYYNSGDVENAFTQINLYPYNKADTKYITFLNTILISKMDRIINKELNVSVKEGLLKIKNNQDLLLKYFIESKEKKVDFEEFILTQIN